MRMSALPCAEALCNLLSWLGRARRIGMPLSLESGEFLSISVKWEESEELGDIMTTVVC